MKEYSVKNRVLILLLILLGMVLFVLLYCNYFAIRELEKKTAEASSNTLYIQCQNMEKMMDSITVAMVNITSEQVPFQQLAYGSSKEYENYVNAFDTQEGIEDMMYPYSDWCCSVLISLPKQVNRLVTNRGYNLGATGSLLKQTLWEIAEDEEKWPGNTWFPLKVGESFFLVRMIGYRSTFLFSAILLDKMVLVQNNDNANQALTFFFDDTQVYSNVGDAEKFGLTSGEGEGYYFVGRGKEKYMVIESELHGSSIRVAYLTPRISIWKNIGMGHSFLIFLSACMLLTLPLGYFLLKRMFFRPLDRLVEEMEEMTTQRQLPQDREPFREREFIRVDETMHEMVNEISHLKIEKYEKELQITQVQLEYYRVQIRPHFYINCLKSIYGMLQTHQYQDTQKLIVCLSHHLRYMLREHRNQVPLREELRYIENYIELQKISMQYPPECRIACEPDMEDYLIPAVSLLSFVENSVKYSIPGEGRLKIQVSAGRLRTEDETLVRFCVSDNGQGFDRETLVKLNSLDEALAQEGHIGILNVVKRFQLEYGKRVYFTFSNYEGAMSEIFLSEKKEPGNESVNCG